MISYQYLLRSISSMYSLGEHTLSVDVALFAENRHRLCSAIKNVCSKKAAIVLQGGIDKKRYNTDADDLPFRQESYFFWLFGVHESSFNGIIDVNTEQTILIAPKLSPDYAIWQGKIQSTQYFTDKYRVNETKFEEKSTIADTLISINADIVLLLKAQNTDSGNILEPIEFFGIQKFSIDTNILYPIIAELRVFKTDRELDVLRYSSKIGCNAHRDVMKSIRPNMYEYQLESGCNGAILHYGHENAPNDRKILDGDLCLFDMGPEYCCYCSDVTTTFPVNGKFSEKQKLIYNAVLKANRAVFESAKPGVRWTDMHLLAERVILGELKLIGLVHGEIDDMMNVRLGAIFMPHGLGHFYGLDVHDVGGYLGDATPRSSEMGLNCLRTTRTLAERMTITIEPGCYFIDTLLDRALSDVKQSKFLVANKIAEYRGFGGVRIEDDIIIWANGNENISSDLPRTVDEIEAFMRK